MPRAVVSLLNTENLANVRLAAANQARLRDHEIAWRDRQTFLESRGYMLRPRYRPGWTPSWDLPENTMYMPSHFEDYIMLPARIGVIDATRMSDGTLVYIKRIENDREEGDIARMFSQEPLASDPNNHCVPILDQFSDETNSAYSFLVMPFLRLVDDPPFETPADIIDMVDQLLRGLVFMHAHGVAHRDCAYKNLMMDASALYPKGFHPVQSRQNVQAVEDTERIPRASGHVKYYYIDFGLSIRIAPGRPKLALGGYGRDQDVPELSFHKPYDPFKVDIFIIGNMLRTSVYDKYSNVGFLLPLITAMTQFSPFDRPNASEAERMWYGIKQGIVALQSQWRLRSRTEFLPESVLLDGVNLVERSFRLGRRIFGWVTDLQG